MLAKNENKNNSKVSNNDSPVLDLNNSAIKSLIKKGKTNENRPAAPKPATMFRSNFLLVRAILTKN